MIFLSHNHADKPIVEPIAIRLATIFGQDQIFYDSWSIQPGDGIIDKMNASLTSPTHVFFFVSSKSLASNMVKLEWQNALYQSTKGKTKIIPIRVDGCEMPSLLVQNLYIDLHAQGLEAVIHQIVSVIQGNSTFSPQHIGFSNLTYTYDGDIHDSLNVTISASHLLEPNPNFLILTSNKAGEISVELARQEPSRGGFNENLDLGNGIVVNGHAIAPLGGAITPQMPLKITIKAIKNVPIDFKGVFHQKTYDSYGPIPPAM